jgi:hypothetical protein
LHFLSTGLIKRILHIVLTACLSFLLLFGSTSKEFIHLFAGHEDTRHVPCADGKDMQVDNEHHHCSFLSFTLAPFDHDAIIPVLHLYTLPVYAEWQATYQQIHIQAAVSHYFLRGPPAFTV